MLGTFLLILFFLIVWWYLVEYIKFFRTGDPNETDDNYWKFSYDFKPSKKEDFKPDNDEILNKRRLRNKLVFLLYLDVLAIFFLLNIFASQILEKIAN